MQLTWKYIIVIAVSMIAGILIGSSFHSCQRTEPIVVEPIHDTIFRTDTLIKPKWKYRTEHDTTIVVSHDTITINDTIRIAIPIDHYQYADSIVTDSSNIKWDLRYSGYKAKIDTFSVDYTIQPQVQVVEKDNGWSSFIGIGIGVGGGIGYADGKLYSTPQAGLHIVYGWGYHWKKIKK